MVISSRSKASFSLSGSLQFIVFAINLLIFGLEMKYCLHAFRLHTNWMPMNADDGLLCRSGKVHTGRASDVLCDRS